MTSNLLAVESLEESFGPAQQQAYLLLLSRGASPAAACGQLNLSLPAVARAIESDDEFRKLLTRVNELLSQNVAAALYRAAMEGSVSAQTFYLKNRPPPEWPELNPNPQLQPLDELTDDELIAQFRQDAPALLARLAAEDSSSSGLAAAGILSGSSAASR